MGRRCLLGTTTGMFPNPSLNLFALAPPKPLEPYLTPPEYILTYHIFYCI